MLRALPLTGKWTLCPKDRKGAEKCTEWFRTHESLEIDTQNTVLTSLISQGIVGEERRFSSDQEWIIERTFSWEKEEGLHSLIKFPDARKLKINGAEPEGPEVTDLLLDGENRIEAIVPGYFSGQQCYIYSSKRGIVRSAHLRSEKLSGGYSVTLEIDYHAYIEHDETIRIELLGEKSEQKRHFMPGQEDFTVDIFVPDEKITVWQVNGDGKQNVYASKVTVGQVELERRIAFRDVMTRDGKLYVNGREFFAKGAVWPVGRFKDTNRIDMLLSAVVKANMNLLYIEKGHEEPYFYNQCDKMGILVLHGEDNPLLNYHPSFISEKVEYDIFNSISHEGNYFEHILDAVALERWVLKTRSRQDTNGLIYNSLLSTVTPDGHWKPSHYGARRFYADLVPIMYIENGKLLFFISNDSDRDEEVEISIKFMTYGGKKRHKSMYNVTAEAHTALKVGERDLSDTDTRNEFVYMKIRTFNLHRELTLLLDNISSCGYVLPTYTTSVRTINPRSFSIRIKSDKPAFAVHFAMKGHENGSFSDSFFEVRPESEKSVIFTSQEDMTEDEILSSLEIYDLAHAMEFAEKNRD